MKQFIVLIATLLVLLPFPLQTINETRIHAEESVIQKIVHNAKEAAKQEGCFSEETIAKMKRELTAHLPNVNAAEIQVTATDMTQRKERGELIYYKVCVPVKGLVAAAKFYGIAPEDNQTVFVIENWTTSEYLP